MSPAEALREFIMARLAAAAGEIFTVFEPTIVRFQEEIDRQCRLLEIVCKAQIKFPETEQHIGNQRTMYGVKQEEHEAPHIKEEDVVGVIFADGESDNSHQCVRDLTTQRLAAAAGEIFTMFEQTAVQYKEEIERQRGLLEIVHNPQVKLHRIELPQNHDCKEEQLFKLETNSCSENEEPEPPDIEEQEELGTNLERERLLLKFLISDTFLVPSFEEQSSLSEPEEALDAEQFISQEFEVHSDSESTRNVRLKNSDHSDNCPVSGKQAECEKLLCDNTSGRIVHKKQSGKKQSSKKQNEKKQSGKKQNDKKKAFCEICGEGFNRKAQLSIHLKTHRSEKPYSCPICSKRFTQRYGMVTHMRCHTGETPYSCQTCGKRFHQYGSWWNHKKCHTAEKPHSCQTCGKRFGCRSGLLSHVRLHNTDENPFSCQPCGIVFSQRKTFETHMRYCKSEKPYSCETCGKGFRQKTHLLLHMRIHTGEKPYSCKTCGKSYRVQTSLLAHMRTHSGRPYSCGTCGKGFTSWHYLLEHMKTHTDEKPNSSGTDGKSFGQHLLHHRRTCTDEKPYSCKACGEIFGTWLSLLQHMSTHAGEN